MASRSLGTLTIDLLMKTFGLEQGADKAEKRLAQLNKTAKAVGAALGTAIAAGATAATVALQSSINAMDDLSKAAQRSGITTESFSALAYAANLADVSIQDLQGSLGKLAKAQGDALNSTTRQAKLFKALGIDIKDASGNLREADEVFADFADAFQRSEGSPEIMAAGLQLFGRSFQNIIPLIKDGSAGLRDAAEEAERFGQVISTEAGKNAEQFNDNLSRLKLAAQGLANEVAANLLPDLVELSEQFLGTATNGQKLNETASEIADGIRVLGTAIGYVAKAFKIAGEGIGASLAQAHAGMLLLQGDFRGAATLYREAQQGFLSQVGLGSDTAQAGGTGGSGQSTGGRRGRTVTIAPQVDRAAIREALANETVKKGGGGKSQAQQDAERLAEAYKSLNDQLDETIALYGNTSQAAKLNYDLQNGELAKLTEAQKQELRDKQSKITLLGLEEAAQRAVTEASDEYAESVERQQEAFERQREDLEFSIAALGMSNKELARENELRWLGAEATEEQRQAISDLSDAYYEQQEAMSQSIELQDTFRQAFSDSVSDFLTGSKSAKDAFLDFLDAINQRLSQMVAENFADQLFGQQGQNGGGSQGGWLSSLASIFSSNGGGGDTTGTLASLFSSNWGFASGGTAAPYSINRVNEIGMEMATVNGRDYLLTGSKPVEVTPNRALGKGGVNQTVNFIVQGRPDPASQQQAAQKLGQLTNSAIRRNA